MVCEERRGAARMKEDNGVVASEFALLDMVNKARHRFSGVNGVKENTLRFGNEFEGINTFPV